MTATARTIDHALVLAQGKGALAIVSPGMADTLRGRLQKHVFPMDKVELKDVTEQTRCVTINSHALSPLANALKARLHLRFCGHWTQDVYHPGAPCSRCDGAMGRGRTAESASKWAHGAGL